MELIATALNDAHGTDFEPAFLVDIGREVLQMEWQFNRQAGFTEADDELPSFFYDEALAPSGKTLRHDAAAVNKHLSDLLGGPKDGAAT